MTLPGFISCAISVLHTSWYLTLLILPSDNLLPNTDTIRHYCLFNLWSWFVYLHSFVGLTQTWSLKVTKLKLVFHYLLDSFVWCILIRICFWLEALYCFSINNMIIGHNERQSQSCITFKLWRTLWHECAQFLMMLHLEVVRVTFEHSDFHSDSTYNYVKLKKKLFKCMFTCTVSLPFTVTCVFTVKYKHKIRKQSKSIRMFQNRAQVIHCRDLEQVKVFFLVLPFALASFVGFPISFTLVETENANTDLLFFDVVYICKSFTWKLLLFM